MDHTGKEIVGGEMIAAVPACADDGRGATRRGPSELHQPNPRRRVRPLTEAGVANKASTLVFSSRCGAEGSPSLSFFERRSLS